MLIMPNRSLLIIILGEEDYAAGRRHWKNGSFSSCYGCKINRDFHDRFIREESFLKSDTQKINMYKFASFPQYFVNTKRVSMCPRIFIYNYITALLSICIEIFMDTLYCMTNTKNLELTSSWGPTSKL